MRKIFTMGALLLLGAIALWQCKDDNEWDKPAIGGLGASDYKFSNAGGSKILKFNTTADWTASVKYADGATQTSWLTVSPTNGKAGAGEVTITIAPSTTYETQVAQLLINAGGAIKTYNITQTMMYALTAKSHDYLDLNCAGNQIDVPVERNIEYSVTYEPATASQWISKNISKAQPIVDTISFTIAANDASTSPRSAKIILTNDKLKVSDTINISQGAYTDVGKYLGMGNYLSPTAMKNADGSIAAWALSPATSDGSKNVNLYTGGQQPLDIQGSGNPGLGSGPVGVRLPCRTAWNNLRVVACTWSNSNPTADGFGGIVYLKMYLWTDDYATTVASSPILTKTIKYNDNETVTLIGTNVQYPAGDYLVVLTSDKVTSGVWVADAVEAYPSFMRGKEWKYIPKYSIDFLGDTKGGVGVMAYINYKSDALSDADFVKCIPSYELNRIWLDNASSPDQVSVTKGANYFYATFNKAKNGTSFGVARSAGVEGPWNVWNATKATWTNAGPADVWTGVSSVSMVEKSGMIYIYTVVDNKLMVATATATSNTWPSAIGAAKEAYAFDAKLSGVAVDVKYHADKNAFVATYINGTAAYTLTSADGMSFTAVAAPVIAALRPSPAAVRYVAMTTDGAVHSGQHYITYSQSKGAYMIFK